MGRDKNKEEARVAETVISRMAGNAFGAMATLPLICLGRLGEGRAVEAVLERFDVWRSCLVVGREMLRTVPQAKRANKPLIDLLSSLESLRDAFLELSRFEELSHSSLMGTHQKIVSSYRRIEDALAAFEDGLGIPVTFLEHRSSLRQVSHDRSLEWLLRELEQVKSKQG